MGQHRKMKNGESAKIMKPAVYRRV